MHATRPRAAPWGESAPAAGILAGARARGRRAAGRALTGPAAHLLAGSLDLLEALARYGLARARTRSRR